MHLSETLAMKVMVWAKQNIHYIRKHLYKFGLFGWMVREKSIFQKPCYAWQYWFWTSMKYVWINFSICIIKEFLYNIPSGVTYSIECPHISKVWRIHIIFICKDPELQTSISLLNYDLYNVITNSVNKVLEYILIKPVSCLIAPFLITS